MINDITRLVSALCLLGLTSCTTSTEHAYYYNEILIRNNTSSPLADVVIQVKKTNKVFRCSNIAPRGTCSNRFQKKKYQHNSITITWLYNNRSRLQRQILLEVPKTADPAYPLRGVLVIKQDGSIQTYFEQGKYL